MAFQIYFNPLDTACKNVIGAVCQGQTLQLQIFNLKRNRDNCMQTPDLDECFAPNERARLLLRRDGEEIQSYDMKQTPFGWSISFNINEIGLYYYSFVISENQYVSCGTLELGYLSAQECPFLLLVYAENYKTPKWFKGGVMYQIFPDRFYKSGSMPDIKGRIRREDWGSLPSYKPNEYGKVLNNDFFGGNLRGICEKLPYLKELGVTVIYLNPIFEAASNHRYDTSDYMKIDPFLGTEEDFQELVNTAKTIGIRIILDGVFNHTGDNSVYFNKYGNYPSVGAYQSKDSPYYKWYSFEKFPNKYASWWGIDILPEVNEASPEYQEFIFGKEGVLRKWLGLGISGYRLDVADELPDFFLQSLRKSVKAGNRDAIVIGEVWEDASDKVAYSERKQYFQGYELDSVMNYPWKEAIIQYIQSGNATDLLQVIRAIINHYPKQSLDCLMNILGTHDTARILTVLGGIYCQNKDDMAKETAYLSKIDKERAVEKLKMSTVLQYTLPGVPCVYYGDENGAEGHIDPFCRQCFDWEHLNTDLVGFYRKLGTIRKKYRNIFKDGEFEALRAEDGLLFFKRINASGTIYVFVNNSSKRYLLNYNGTYLNLINDTKSKDKITINPYEYGILIKRK